MDGNQVMSLLQNRTNFLYRSKLSQALSVVGLLIVKIKTVSLYRSDH